MLLFRDFRFAFRVLASRPVFALVAALWLGLGIGANYRRGDHQALRLAQCLRLYGIGWTWLAGGLAVFVSAAPLESLAARGRIRETETSIAATG